MLDRTAARLPLPLVQLRLWASLRGSVRQRGAVFTLVSSYLFAWNWQPAAESSCNMVKPATLSLPENLHVSKLLLPCSANPVLSIQPQPIF